MNTTNFHLSTIAQRMFAGAVLVMLSPLASASLFTDPDGVSIEWFNPNAGTSFAGPTIVAPVDDGFGNLGLGGNEVNCPGAQAICKENTVGSPDSFNSPTIFDIGSNTIYYQQNSLTATGARVIFSSNLNLFMFSSLDWGGLGGTITGVGLASNNISGLTGGDVSFGADWVSVNMQSTILLGAGSATGNYTLTLTVEHNTEDDGGDDDGGPFIPAPEPSGFALFGVGLVGAVAARRRRKKV